MRVKKLSANRRPKAGDDDDSSSSSPSAPPAAKWISPTKHDQQHDQQLHHHHQQQRGTASDIGSSSPTDPSGVHPLELADAHLATPRLLFSDVIAMANSQHPHHLQQQQQSARDGATATNARKPLASAAAKKTTSGGVSWREQMPSSVRDSIHAKIVDYLKALKPNAPEAVLARLPGLASRMEKTLLQLANSQEEFVDPKSLASRLGAIQQSSTKKLLQQQTAPLPSPSMSGASSAASFSSADAALRSRTPLSEDQARFVFQCLQSWRQKLVNIYGVAPWEILPNAILAKVAVYAPSSEQELSICGVRDELIARFGSSLLKELQLICGTTARTVSSPAGGAAAARNGGKMSRKAESGKRPQEPKKRKTSVLVPADSSSSARVAPTNSFLMPSIPNASSSSNTTSTTNGSTMLPLFRAGVDSLPALLPSASVMKPPPQQLFAPRLPSPRTPSSSSAAAAVTTTTSTPQAEELHHSMHLLAQGAGHVSKQQQDAQTIDSYEKELQATRWQLQQAQQENERLREQVQQLLHHQQQQQHP